MSAFNKGQFNLARYNVEVGGIYWLSGSAYATFRFSFAGETFYCRGNSRASFIADNLQLDRGRCTQGSAIENFGQNAYALGYFSFKANVYESFNRENLNLSQIAMLTTENGPIETLDQDAINLSQSAYIDGGAYETFDIEKCNLGQIIFESSDCGEVFASSADVISLSEYVCEFSGLTLKPGQVLVVDASSFNILLDGKNAIHLHKGEWLDDLNRNTQSITITGTGASRLTAEILYTERYL